MALFVGCSCCYGTEPVTKGQGTGQEGKGDWKHVIDLIVISSDLYPVCTQYKYTTSIHSLIHTWLISTTEACSGHAYYCTAWHVQYMYWYVLIKIAIVIFCHGLAWQNSQLHTHTHTLCVLSATTFIFNPSRMSSTEHKQLTGDTTYFRLKNTSTKLHVHEVVVLIPQVRVSTLS